MTKMWNPCLIAIRTDNIKKLVILFIVGLLILIGISFVCSRPTIQKYLRREANKVELYRLKIYYINIKPEGIEA